MFSEGHPHSELLMAIDAVGEVPCQRLPEVFFPEDLPEPEVRTEAEAAAKRLCADCPIRNLCASYAVETGQAWGIWGGLNAEEIRALRGHRL